MAAQFQDEASGKPVLLKPDRPPAVDVAWDRPRNPRMLSFLRTEALAAALIEALAHLGFAATQDAAGRAVDLYFGSSEPPMPARCWLKPGPVEDVVVNEVLDRGFTLEDVRLFCLARHYRKPLAIDFNELAARRDELVRLRDLSARLASQSALAPNPAGVAGYKKRFRDALARDLDLPEAWASLWDALRPGALSPGSQAAMIRESAPVFALSLPLASRP